MDGKAVKHKGLSYKFPFHTKKQTYQFFDVTAKKAYPMTYKGSEKILGLTVYRFEQPIAPIQTGTSKVPSGCDSTSASFTRQPTRYSDWAP